MIISGNKSLLYRRNEANKTFEFSEIDRKKIKSKTLDVSYTTLLELNNGFYACVEKETNNLIILDQFKEASRIEAVSSDGKRKPSNLLANFKQSYYNPKSDTVLWISGPDTLSLVHNASSSPEMSNLDIFSFLKDPEIKRFILQGVITTKNEIVVLAHISGTNIIAFS